MELRYIDPTQADKTHIDLYCVNHPELRWFTKNIDYIGARNIFFPDDQGQPECKCPLADLRVLNPFANLAPSATTQEV